jgi:hypothetical protein
VPQQGELAEQEGGGHAVADKQGGRESRHERVDLGQLQGSKGPCDDKDDHEGQQKGARHAALTRSGRDIRQDLRLGRGARCRGQGWVLGFRHRTLSRCPAVDFGRRRHHGWQGRSGAMRESCSTAWSRQGECYSSAVPRATGRGNEP